MVRVAARCNLGVLTNQRCCIDAVVVVVFRSLSVRSYETDIVMQHRDRERHGAFILKAWA